MAGSPTRGLKKGALDSLKRKELKGTLVRTIPEKETSTVFAAYINVIIQH